MLLKNHPHKKHIVIGLAVIVVIGFAIMRNSDDYNFRYGTSSYAPAPPESGYMEDIRHLEAMTGGALAADEAEMYADMKAMALPVEDGSVAVDIPQEDRLIIKKGNMSLVVDDVSIAVDQVAQFTTEQGGFVVTSNIQKTSYRPSGFVTVRIPSDVFDTGLDAIRALGDVQSERVDGRDVTEEYIDLEAQKTNLEATEAQFLTIMRQAVKIQDILSVQRELTNVRSQIERLEGRMKFLKESAAFSSLTVHLSSDPEDLPILDDSDAWKPLATIKDAVRELRDIGISIADAIIWVVVYIPLWIGLLIVFLLGRKVYRKWQR